MGEYFISKCLSASARDSEAKVLLPFSHLVAGILVEGHGVAPWDVAVGDWKHWNGSQWAPSPEMSVKCLEEGKLGGKAGYRGANNNKEQDIMWILNGALRC